MAQNVEYCDQPLYATKARDLPDLPSGAIGSGLAAEFEYALTDLEEVLGTLGLRLYPALTPSYDTDGPERACEPAPQVCGLRVQLHRTHKVAADLRGLIDRLEV